MNVKIYFRIKNTQIFITIKISKQMIFNINKDKKYKIMMIKVFSKIKIMKYQNYLTNFIMNNYLMLLIIQKTKYEKAIIKQKIFESYF